MLVRRRNAYLYLCVYMCVCKTDFMPSIAYIIARSVYILQSAHQYVHMYMKTTL